MADASSRAVLRHIKVLFQCGAAAQQSDAELLARFMANRGEAAEAAFAALVERHGAMVLGVCERVLGNRHAAEDAFQATFLVLARKAAAIAGREQLASWLYGVARRAALDARARAARQRAREKRLSAMLPTEPPDPFLSGELRTILDEELARLPERHRTAIVLCELEGLSRREAAARLGISEGTLSSRLARARSRLKERLTRRGITLSAAALASALAQEARAAIVPPALIDSTTRVAAMVAAGSSLAGVVSTSVATLTEGVLKTMLLAKLKSAALGLGTLVLITSGVTALAQPTGSAARADDDRLKAVEQKLDKLLELLGGMRHLTPSPSMPVTTPVPPPPTGSTPEPSPFTLPAPAGTPVPRATTDRTTRPSVSDRQPGSAWAPQAYEAARTYAMAPHADPQPLLGRVEALEHRLSELERRLGELELSVRRSGGTPAPAAAPGTRRDRPTD